MISRAGSGTYFDCASTECRFCICFDQSTVTQVSVYFGLAKRTRQLKYRGRSKLRDL
jgi:hypothetical protein